jgi:hypothetical protein
VELLKDRSHYRKCEDSLLLEEALYNPNAELAIVLGERLEAAWAEHEDEAEKLRDRAADFERDANKLDDENYTLTCEIDRLNAVVDDLSAQIEQLKEQNDD